MREFGFTLAEMMVVMLIMSIIMAAMAPVMTTRMKNDNSSPWKWCENKVDAYFGNSDKQIAMIGQRAVGADENNAKLIIRANDDRPNHILFKKGNNIVGQLRMVNTGILLGTRTSNGSIENAVLIGKGIENYSGIAIGNNINNGEGGVVVGNNSKSNSYYSTVYGHGINLDTGSVVVGSIAIGSSFISKGGNNIVIARTAYPQIPITNGTGNVVIGNDATTVTTSTNSETGEITASGTKYAVAIGSGAKATGESSIAIRGAANSEKSIAIGANAEGSRAIAIGNSAYAPGNGSIAIGSEDYRQRWQAEAHGTESIAIGRDAKTATVTFDQYGKLTEVKQAGNYALALGRSARAINNYSIAIGYEANCSGINSVCIGKEATTTENNYIELGTSASTVNIQGSLKVAGVTVTPSDRRLKYVGKEFTSGLDKIRALKPYNYTFKKDETKTPRVGVMAQDLQKIFPNAVKKGTDGFLTIRMEDMFYALINAVKELDEKVTALTNEVKELRKENKEIMQRLKALEG